MTVCAGYSQTASRDTVCLPTVQVLQSIRAADSLRIMKQELKLLQEANTMAAHRIEDKDSTIKILFQSNDLFMQSALGFKASADNALRQRDLQQLDTEYYKNLLRKQKRRTAFMGFVTFAGIAATVFLMK